MEVPIIKIIGKVAIYAIYMLTNSCSFNLSERQGWIATVRDLLFDNLHLDRYGFQFISLVWNILLDLVSFLDDELFILFALGTPPRIIVFFREYKSTNLITSTAVSTTKFELKRTRRRVLHRLDLMGRCWGMVEEVETRNSQYRVLPL